jgi:hypothetical protein
MIRILFTNKVRGSIIKPNKQKICNITKNIKQTIEYYKGDSK